MEGTLTLFNMNNSCLDLGRCVDEKGLADANILSGAITSNSVQNKV